MGMRRRSPLETTNDDLRRLRKELVAFGATAASSGHRRDPMKPVLTLTSPVGCWPFSAR